MARTTHNDPSTSTAPQLGQVSADITAARLDFDCERRMSITPSTELAQLVRERRAADSGNSVSNRGELDMLEIVRRVARAKPRILLIGECRDPESAEAKLQQLLNG
jgi:hypothetical protein